MKERQINCKAHEVRALLDGSKTQTRRVVNPQPTSDEEIGVRWIDINEQHQWAWVTEEDEYIIHSEKQFTCPYGQQGDRLWVRETHAPQSDTWGSWENWMRGDGGPAPIIHYQADFKPFQDSQGFTIHKPFIDKWRPSIHMPRWASRILLEVTGVRVERLQNISEADAIAEGIERLNYGGITTYRNYALSDESASVSPMLESPIESYRTLWESINNNRPKLPTNTNSKRYARVLKWLETHPDTTGWDANPWVWVIEFKRVEEA